MKRKRLGLIVWAAVLVTLALITLAVVRRQSISQEVAAKRLRERRCEVIVSDDHPKQPLWSRLIFGSDRLSWANLVRVNRTSLSKSEIHLLTEFPKLSTLVISSCPSVNNILRECASLAQLKHVYIYDCDQLKGEEFKILAESANIETLLIEHDRGSLDLAAIHNAPQLNSLTLIGEAFDDQSALEVSACKELLSVKMMDTRITDRGLIAICKLPKLQILVLREADVTGAALSRLADMKHLKGLDLSGTRVNDAGLSGIQQIKSLRSLVLDSSQVSDVQMAALREALPDCSIIASKSEIQNDVVN